MKQNRPIVDPHQHFWKLGNLHYPWLMDSHESEFGQSHSGLIDYVKSHPDLTNDYLVANLRDDAHGLNLVKTLVEMHGGSVSIESKNGEGSTFTIRLPIAGPDQAEQGEQADTKVA